MQPIDIGSSKQLFVDDRFIATGNGVELTDESTLPGRGAGGDR